jgi:plasmid stability protein
MAQLIVRNLDEEVVKKLKKRAAASGRSVEAEHREILRSVLLGPNAGASLKETLLGIPEAGRDTDFRRNRQKPRKVRL